MINSKIASTARPKLMRSRVSVVLPVYNEARVLPELAERLRTVLGGCEVDFELIFVNDGSADDSADMLDCLAFRYPEVRAVHLSRNFGHQAAVQAGLAHAQGDAVVLMDSDLQDAPEALPKFIEQWRGGYDVVYAIRTERKENIFKRTLFAGFHRFLSSVATTPIPTDAGIFGLIDARVAREIVALGERDRYLPGLRSWVGFRQIGVEVERLARYDDHPRVSLRGLWNLAKTAVFSFSVFPLRMFTLIGLTALGVFLTLGAVSLYFKLFTDLATPGWTSYILTASFFGALNALGIAMLGEYVTRIYDQVRGRPLYLVDRVVQHSPPQPRRRETLAPSAAELVESDEARDDQACGDPAYDDLLAQTRQLLEASAAEFAQRTASTATSESDATGRQSINKELLELEDDYPGVDGASDVDSVNGDYDHEPRLLRFSLATDEAQPSK